VVGCSGTAFSGFPNGAGDGNGGGATGSGGGSGGGIGIGVPTGSGGVPGGFGGSSSGSSSGNGSSSGGCMGQAANFVYVLSEQNDLYSFAPDKKAFAKIGHLGCQTTMQPNSMAIDRNAVAWVNYVEVDPASGKDTAGVIYRVSTKDATCEATPSVTLPAGWYRLGMGYSTDGTSSRETLYVASTGDPNGTATGGLGSIDLASFSLEDIGRFGGELAGKNAELTGTGDGRLFGFFATWPVQVAQIEKTGMTGTPVTMTGLQSPNDWAFSFWGGHFYLYTSQGLPMPVGHGSDVTDYDPASGSIHTAYMTGIGFDIVGAGVSTCAPVAPPQ